MSTPTPGDGSRPTTAARVRDAALAVPGVATLSGGPFGEIATYLPGDRVPGVRFGEDGLHVHVVVTATGVQDLPAVAEAVHEAVRNVLVAVRDEADDERGAPSSLAPVTVHVDDVEGTGRPGDTEVPDDGTRKDES